MRSRLDLTPGQVWTLSLGLVLGLLLLVTSVPPVWERRGQLAPVAAAAPPPPAAPPVGGLVTGLQPPPAPAPLVPAPAAPVVPAPEPLALDAPPAPLPPAPPRAAPAPAPARPPAAPPPAQAAPAPLRVTEAGYTSSGPEPGLPQGGLPVSARLGERLSTVHVRLTGTDRLLEVPLSRAMGANVRTEEARVRACRITTTDWRPERPGPGVPYDVDDCVDGAVTATAVRFDLGVFPQRDSRAGFAIVADLRGSSMTSPRTFRLTLVPEDPA